ncbi:hypothetical protein [Ferirhizobium litorale]|uniref:hypothetical protein n=1 Tax=Ferirhizobium litorale TaxID=2927786 RepID=UPI0035304FF2
MQIGTFKEIYLGEPRVAMTPGSAVQLGKLGHACVIEAGAGLSAGISEDAYRAFGVTVVEGAAASIAHAS